ncbi:MAG: DUF6268 family outer membrane beta-barrel protein [Chloroherpetonaceae bacterium]|nr:DUF6268 family outer membrane beta-barrel protein [Chloroherpetonaceae bacterium]
MRISANQRIFAFSYLLVLVLVFPSTLIAQREQIGVRYEMWGKSEISDSSNTLSSFSVNFNASLRSIFGEEGETLILNGFSYRYLNIIREFPQSQSPPDPLGMPTAILPSNIKTEYHLLQYDLTVLHSLSDEWTAVLALRPGIFSDFFNITWNHFRFEAAGFADYIVSPTFTIGLGIAIQPSNFGRVLPAIPLLHILNNGNLFGKKYLLDVLLPQRADFTMYLSKPLEVGLSVALIGSSYFIGDVKNRIGSQSDRLAFANATLSGVVRYNLFDKLYITGDAGYTLLRRYEYSVSRYKELGVDERPDATSFDLPNAYFLRAGISILY